MAKRESEKIEKYQIPCGKLGISFSPIAFDSHGGMAPSTLKTIQEMISLAAFKHSIPVETATHMWQRLSFALAQHIACQLLISAVRDD